MLLLFCNSSFSFSMVVVLGGCKLLLSQVLMALGGVQVAALPGAG